jgi:acetophenone carboxylase
MERVHLFAFGTVFSAYGSAISDVLHVYECATDGVAAHVRDAGMELLAQARRDLAGEGFEPAAARYEWTLENDARKQVSARTSGAKGLDKLAARLPDASLLRLAARFALGEVLLPERAVSAAPEITAHRASPLAAGAGAGLPVYQHAALSGHRIAGPCVVDGGTFTWLIEAGWSIAIDKHGDAVATREVNA